MSLDLYLTIEVDAGGPDGDEVVHLGESQNYTHNVTPMWQEAGCYDALYMSDGARAADTVPDLRAAVADMEAHPAKYEAMNPENGWGKYSTALPWLRQWLAQCERYPKAIISVSK